MEFLFSQGIYFLTSGPLIYRKKLIIWISYTLDISSRFSELIGLFLQIAFKVGFCFLPMCLVFVCLMLNAWEFDPKYLFLRIVILRDIQGWFLYTWKTNYQNIRAGYLPTSKKRIIPSLPVRSQFLRFCLAIFFFLTLLLLPSFYYSLMPWDPCYQISSLRGICYSSLAERIKKKKAKTTEKQMNIIPNHSVQCTLYKSSYSSSISNKNYEKKSLIHNHFQKMSIIEFQPTVPSVQTLSQTAKIIFIAQISKMYFLIKVHTIYLH